MKENTFLNESASSDELKNITYQHWILTNVKTDYDVVMVTATGFQRLKWMYYSNPWTGSDTRWVFLAE